MKVFNGARVQFTSVDPVTEEKSRFSLGDLMEDAAPEVIQGIGDALDTVVDGGIEEIRLTQTFDIA